MGQTGMARPDRQRPASPSRHANWLLLTLLLWSACALAAPPRIVDHDTNGRPRWDAGGAGPSIEFDQPMLTWINGSGQAPDVKVEPALPCTWEWNDDTTLECHLPDRATVAKATTYRISARGLWSQAGEQMAAQSVTVDTERPFVGAYLDRWQDGWPVFWIHPDQDVTLQQLQSHVRLEDASGHPIEAVWGRRKARDEERWTLTPRVHDGHDVVVQVHVLPGLQGTAGPLPGQEDGIEAKAIAAESFQVRDHGCSRYGRFDGSFDCFPGESLGIGFSARLSDDARQRLANAVPAGLKWVATQPEAARRNRDREHADADAVSYKVLDPRATIRFAFPSGLTDNRGRALPPTPPFTITTGDRPSIVEIAPTTQWLVAPNADARQRIAATNVSGGQIDEDAIGATRAKKTQAFSTPADNRPAPVDAPAIPDEILRHGGLVEFSVQGKPYFLKPYEARGKPRLPVPVEGRDLRAVPMPSAPMSFAGNYQVAVAGWQVVAAADGDDELVWVTRWRQGVPAQGAKVELIAKAGKTKGAAASDIPVLATGTTDGDGYAQLRLPKVRQDGEVLVRVSKDGIRTVMPLRYAIAGNYSTGNSALLWQWGVTDRPLYQPGDALHYRLWLREHHRNHLRAATLPHEVTLSLFRDYESVRTWTAAVAANGAVSGDLQLPADAVDTSYCISATVPADVSGNGACFRVSRFEAAEMWAKTAPLPAVSHVGDKLAVDIESGFYSGGPAGVADVKVEAHLDHLSPAQAFPAYADYRFLDNASLPNDVTPANGLVRKTGKDGKVHMELVVPSPTSASPDHPELVPLAILRVEATVGYPGHAGVTSEAVETRVTRAGRFAGIAIDGGRLDAGKPVRLDAVVLDETGIPQREASVHVVVRERPSEYGAVIEDDEEETPPRVVAECTVPSGGSADCPFSPVEGKRYEFVATSPGAATARFEEYSWKFGRGDEDSRMRLDLPDADAATPIAARSVKVRVRQPFASARLLLTIQHDGLLRHWIERVDGPNATIEVPIDPSWAPGVTLAAVAVDASRADDAPPSDGKLASTLYADMRLAIAKRPPLPVDLTLPARAAPGTDVVLRVHNPRGQSVHATLTLVDQGVLERVTSADAKALDPDGEEWLGGLGSWGLVTWYGFQGWNVLEKGVFGVRAEGGRGGVLAGVEVTGSRIRRVEQEAAAPVMSLDRKGIEKSGAGVRLRTQFLQTAWWEPDLVLAAGETREVHVHLPDNLTTWKAIAWAADDDDGFARSEAKVEVGLPVEARASAPSHLYVGDRSLAEVSARQLDAAHAATTVQGRSEGAGTSAAVDKKADLARGELLQARLELQPTQVGRIDVLAEAKASGSRDATTRQVDVDDAIAAEHVSQAGWLTATPLSMPLPALEASALDPQLMVKLGRIDVLLDDAWTIGLRDYVHRCWEQTLSRAVGASLATTTARGRGQWPDADAVVKEAFEAAPGFVDRGGLFGYFHGADGEVAYGSPILTAYTLDAFDELKGLGHTVPDALIAKATEALEQKWQAMASNDRRCREFSGPDEEAIVAGALAGRKELGSERLRELWNRWGCLSWYARSQLARALHADPDLAPLAVQGLASLREAGTLHGVRRVLESRYTSLPFTMGSLRRDQCAVIRTLMRLDPSEQGRRAVAELQRGLFDLYAGGSGDSDTQASAQCLLAMHAVQAQVPAGQDIVETAIDAGSQHADVRLGAQDSEANWSATKGTPPATLRIVRTDASPAPAAFVANIDNRRDQHLAKPMGTGMHLERRYDVLHDGRWEAVAEGNVHEGDWVRISLVLTTPGFRHFVAVSDPVPGGWVPEDVNLAGVAGDTVRSASRQDSWWFGARQLGTTVSRFYAEHLPPGRNEVVYFAQVRHAGHYFAPPAKAELMYGEASFSRTAPAEVTVLP